MSKYDEDLKKACEILNNTELDELVQIAVEAMDDAATDIGMEASQEWHAKITLESALIHIAEKVAEPQPQLTIPKRIADEVDKYLRMDWEFLDIDQEFLNDCSEEFLEFLDSEDNNRENSKLIIAYLAGKALGVDLVKVVEGELK